MSQGVRRWFPRRQTARGNTITGLWTLIDFFLNREAVQKRKQERAEARAREEAHAQERTRRDNSAAAFDRRMTEKRTR